MTLPSWGIMRGVSCGATLMFMNAITWKRFYLTQPFFLIDSMKAMPWRIRRKHFLFLPLVPHSGQFSPDRRPQHRLLHLCDAPLFFLPFLLFSCSISHHLGPRRSLQGGTIVMHSLFGHSFSIGHLLLL